MDSASAAELGPVSTFLTCANAANFTCVLGYAAAQGRGKDFTAYSKCIDAAGKP